MKKNYHTHHKLCRHARGTAEDYAEAAIKAGLTTLGFSDHAPTRVINDERMAFEELSIYLEDVQAIRERYKDKLSVHIGLEIEYLDDDPGYYASLKEQVEYFILGQHYLPRKTPENELRATVALKKGEDLIEYAKSVQEALSTGLFELVAHPEIYMAGYPRFDEYAKEAAEIIAQASLEYDVPLEFNANGIRRGLKAKEDGLHYQYPRREFWAIAVKKGCKAVLSADAHAPSQLDDRAIRKSEALIKEWGIPTRDLFED
ncbi:MAG: histidinol-phosphatase [Bacillota bacterium]